MKIIEVIPFVLNEDLEKEFFFSQWEYSNRKISIVKIICDNGLVGWVKLMDQLQLLRKVLIISKKT